MRAPTICNVPNCPATATQRGRCGTHARQADQARGTRQQRGYGADYDRQRAAIVRALRRGETVHCWRCQGVVTEPELHLGHDDQDRSIIRGAEHRACNLAAAGRAAHRPNRT